MPKVTDFRKLRPPKGTVQRDNPVYSWKEISVIRRRISRLFHLKLVDKGVCEKVLDYLTKIEDELSRSGVSKDYLD